MPTLKNAFLALTALILLAVASVATAIASGWTRRFDAPYPAVTASADPAVLAQGRYLAYGPAACAYCHVPRDRWNELARGVELPLAGGHQFPLPFGDFYSANLTADQETGIGRRTDGELARILRHGIRADGHAAVPLMAYQGMSDEDLVAVISFVRSQGPVVNRVPANRLTALGKALMAFVITPEGPAAPPPTKSPAGPSVERGEYLAVKVASCVECHTNRDDRGALVGPHFAGGQRMEVANEPSKVYVPPNLTPDIETSAIGRWPEDVFVQRFRLGEIVPGTPMPWGAYGRMTDDDLRSVYRYLRSLPPASNDTGPRVQPKG
jgi:mono/diheme cytochrome c family protein